MRNERKRKRTRKKKVGKAIRPHPMAVLVVDAIGPTEAAQIPLSSPSLGLTLEIA
jgi:hypothetical protein